MQFLKKFREISKKISHTGSCTLTFSCTTVFREFSLSPLVPVHTLVFYVNQTSTESNLQH